MTENKQRLEANSLRECNFYIKYMQKQFNDFQIDDSSEFRSVDDYLNAIDDEIYHRINDNKKYEQLINKMMHSFNSEQLNKEVFRWLNINDERFCNWIWCYLRSESKQKKRRTRHKSDDLVLGEDIYYPHLDSNRCSEVDSQSFNNSNNLQDRHKDVIASFHYSELELSEQKEVFKYLIDEWEPIFMDKRIVNWLLKSNPQQCEWVWEYLGKFDRELTRKVWSPTNNNELKSAIIALFDLLHDRPDRKTLLIGNMKRAWSQKKFRDKNEGKKAYSISMTESTKSQLDLLAEKKSLKLNETVEALIRAEFKRLNS